MDLTFKIKKFVIENNLMDAGDHAITAVSGGIDSIAMLHILNSIKDDIGFYLSVAHVNHCLRGKASDFDEKFVEKLCKSLKLPFYSEKWNGPKKGENLQDSARDFRYAFFLKLANKITANKIALAHNMNDQAETMILNMIRGSSLDGLCGMAVTRPISNDKVIIRPLLKTLRKDIASYIESIKANYRHDKSNDELKYSRNIIRHKLFPIISDLNSNINETLYNLSELLKLDEDFLQNYAANIFSKGISSLETDNIIFSIFQIQHVPVAVRYRIFKLAYMKINGSVLGLTRDHILRMDQISTGSKDAKYNLPNSLLFKKKGASLAIFLK